MMPYPMAATRAGKAVGAAFAYLLGPFRFSTDQAAPLTSPYTEAGAVGSLTVVDTNNVIATSGAVAVVNGTPAINNGIVTASTFARLCGRSLLWRLPTRTTITSNGRWYWSLNPLGVDAPADLYIRPASPTTVIILSVGVVIDTITIGSGDWSLALIQRGTGGYFLYRNGTSGPHTLGWVWNTSTTSPLSGGVCWAGSAAQNYTLDDLRALDLGTYDARFATDEGLATDRKATSSAGDTITMRADALVEHTLTAATGVDKDFYVRWTDDNNCWIVRQNQAGSTVKLVEKVAGVETSRMSVAQTFTNATAYRLIAVCEGSTITVYVGNTKAGAYASATTNQTATTAKAPVAGLELKAYPRTVTLPSGI